MMIADLFARIGLKTPGMAKAKSFHRVLITIKTGMFVAATAAVGLSLAIKKITDASFDAAASLKQFEMETGASTTELQKWQQVAEQTNQSARAVTESIKNLAANREKIRLGQGDISGFQLLGIDPQQDPFDILEELRIKTKGLSTAMRKNILSQMGVSADLIQVLDMTKEKFDAMASMAFIIPKSAINSMHLARGSMQQVGQAVKWLKSLIAAELAPAIAKLNKQIIIWIKNNKDGIIKTIKTGLKWLLKFTGAIVNSAKMINEIIQGTIGWKKAMFALIAVIGILNAQLLLSPIGLIIAGIILLLLVMEDLYVYSKGGKSLFGVMMEQFPEFEKKMLGFFEIISNVKELMANLFSGDQPGIDKMIAKLGNLGIALIGVFGYLEIVVKYWEAVFSIIINSFGFFIDLIGTIIGTLVRDIISFIKVSKGEMTLREALSPKPIIEMFSKIKKSFMEKLGKGGIDISDLGKTGMEKFTQIQNALNINMEINTTADAEETARLVTDKLQKVIDQASSQISRDE